MGTRMGRRLSIVAALIAFAAPAEAQMARFDLDTVRAGRFDFGKMWTFEYAPSEYFTTTYGFDADEAWFERARLSVLRIPGCSASFVSPNGLVATNHHCVRSVISRVTRGGESLLDDGFVARSLAEERRDFELYADQLIAIEDASDEVFAAIDRARSAEERGRAEQERWPPSRRGSAGDTVAPVIRFESSWCRSTTAGDTRPTCSVGSRTCGWSWRRSCRWGSSGGTPTISPIPGTTSTSLS